MSQGDPKAKSHNTSSGTRASIRQALDDARASGRDHLTQTEEAVRAVLQARPGMTASEALAAVNVVRQS